MNGQTTTTINFDTATSWVQGSAAFTSYSNHGYSEASWNFTSAAAIRNGTAAQDSFAGALGTYSWRLQNNTSSQFTATYNASMTVAGFGFDVRRWDGSPDNSFVVDYSTNSGATFTSTGITINNAYLNDSSDWKTLAFTLPSPVTVASGQFVVKVYATVAGERIMIDNFQWTTGAAGPDTTPPSVASVSPSGPGASVSSNLVITFSEPVVSGAGNVMIYQAGNPSPVETIAASSGSISLSETEVTFDPVTTLAGSTTYYVQIDSNAFYDKATSPNAFPGISDDTTWSFTTVAPDTVDPSVLTLSPADNATDALPAGNLVLTFDEVVQAGSGTISLFKTAGDVLVEEFNAETDISVSAETVTINPTLLLEPGVSYYVTMPSGVILDLANNPAPAIAGPTGWNFTVRPQPAVVINQYYEGAGTDRYVELKNTTGAELDLNGLGYRLTVWSTSGADGNQGWKTGFGFTDRDVSLDGVVIPAGGTVLIANLGAVNPAYAAVSADYKDSFYDPTTFFSGTSSLVLYMGATNDLANVMDAISVVGSEGSNTSFYRLTDVPDFTFATGSSITDNLGQAWAQIDTALVDAAASTDAFYLQGNVAALPPSLDSFVVGGDAVNSVTPRVTLDFTWSDGLPAEYMVSELSDFSDTTWAPLPGTAPVYTLSAGAGTKTIYFKISNVDGESSVLSDTIESVAYSNPGTVLITQYYEGTASNKYLELTNISAGTVDLAGWTIVRWTNAEAENWKVTQIAPGGSSASIALAGTLAAGETVVIANNSATTPVDPIDAFLSTSILNHNGNDSLVLYQGAITPENIRDAVGFTNAGNEGANISFVRITEGVGFGFDEGDTPLDFPAVWQSVDYGDVNIADSSSNLFLGTYPGGPASGSGYADWIDGFYPSETDPEVVGFGADPDGDGIPNGLEALMGTFPDSGDGSPFSDVSLSGADFIFFYFQSMTAPDGVTAGYEWSTDMVNWQGSGDSFGGTTVTISDEIWDDFSFGDLAQYRVVATVTAGTPGKVFVRVVSTNP